VPARSEDRKARTAMRRRFDGKARTLLAALGPNFGGAHR